MGKGDWSNLKKVRTCFRVPVGQQMSHCSDMFRTLALPCISFLLSLLNKERRKQEQIQTTLHQPPLLIGVSGDTTHSQMRPGGSLAFFLKWFCRTIQNLCWSSQDLSPSHGQVPNWWAQSSCEGAEHVCLGFSLP